MLRYLCDGERDTQAATLGTHSSAKPARPLLPAILATTAALALQVALFLWFGAGPVLARIPSYNPITRTFALVASLSVGFLALSRYRVLRDPMSYWIGTGFASVSIALTFHILVWPGLLPSGASLIGHSPDCPFWTARPGSFVLAFFFLAAALARYPGKHTFVGRHWASAVAAWLLLFLSLELVLVHFEHRLPALVHTNGTFAGPTLATQWILVVVFGVGAIISTRRYLRSGNSLLGYVALCQIAYAFSELSLSIGAKRYDLWWYTSRIVLAGSFLVVMFGLLSEYVGLFRREHEKSVELQSKSAQLEAALQALSSDISHRERIAQALRESEAQVRQLADAMPQLVWCARADGEHEYFNRQWYSYTGTTFKDCGGERWSNFLHPDDRQRTLEHWHRSLQTGEPYEVEYRYRRASDGVFRWFIGRALPVRDTQGNVVRWFGTCTDIDALKKAQEALVRSEKLASVGRMAMTIAHEINNPLEAVMNTLFILQGKRDLPDSVRSHLAVADSELRRIAHISKQALGFYRESAAPAVTSVSEILESVLDLLKSKIKAKHAVIVKDWDRDLDIYAVSGELRQVFSNLLSNSLDAIEDDGTIKIRASRVGSFKDPQVRITVADNGKGIAAMYLPCIFDPFFTTKDSIGTGLGLWVSKQIIDKHGGSIRVRSSTNGPRRGTAFSILLSGTHRVAERPQFMAAAHRQAS